jgi:hypothetical protein
MSCQCLIASRWLTPGGQQGVGGDFGGLGGTQGHHHDAVGLLKIRHGRILLEEFRDLHPRRAAQRAEPVGWGCLSIAQSWIG